MNFLSFFVESLSARYLMLDLWGQRVTGATAQTPSGMDDFILSSEPTAPPLLYCTHTCTCTLVCAVNRGVHLGRSSHRRPAERETSFRQQRLIILHLTLRDPSRLYSYDLIKWKEGWSPTLRCWPAGLTKSHRHTVWKNWARQSEGMDGGEKKKWRK